MIDENASKTSISSQVKSQKMALKITISKVRLAFFDPIGCKENL